MDIPMKPRCEPQRRLYIHAMINAAVIAFLLLVHLMTGGERWGQRPMFGWGVAVAINGIAVFSQASLFGPA